VEKLKSFLNRSLLFLALIIGVLFFLLPIYASTVFALQDVEGNYSLDPISRAFANEEITRSLLLTLRISVLTVVLTLLVLIPTVAWLHIVVPQARKFVEFLSLLPLVIPPIVQGVGFLYSMPSFLKSTPYALVFAYMILAMPFTYRALDAAFSAIDTKTLYEASLTLGAKWRTLVFRILIPNVRTGIFAATFLILALVLGEFAYASLLLWDTFPTVLAVAGMGDASAAVALSVLSLLGVWLALNVINLLNKSNRSIVNVGVR
jgi:putative spermidine/putrescine transport system permease protein